MGDCPYCKPTICERGCGAVRYAWGCFYCDLDEDDWSWDGLWCRDVEFRHAGDICVPCDRFYRKRRALLTRCPLTPINGGKKAAPEHHALPSPVHFHGKASPPQRADHESCRPKDQHKLRTATKTFILSVGALAEKNASDAKIKEKLGAAEGMLAKMIELKMVANKTVKLQSALAAEFKHSLLQNPSTAAPTWTKKLGKRPPNWSDTSVYGRLCICLSVSEFLSSKVIGETSPRSPAPMAANPTTPATTPHGRVKKKLFPRNQLLEEPGYTHLAESVQKAEKILLPPETVHSSLTLLTNGTGQIEPTPPPNVCVGPKLQEGPQVICLADTSVQLDTTSGKAGEQIGHHMTTPTAQTFFLPVHEPTPAIPTGRFEPAKYQPGPPFVSRASLDSRDDTDENLEADTAEPVAATFHPAPTSLKADAWRGRVTTAILMVMALLMCLRATPPPRSIPT